MIFVKRNYEKFCREVPTITSRSDLSFYPRNYLATPSPWLPVTELRRRVTEGRWRRRRQRLPAGIRGRLPVVSDKRAVYRRGVCRIAIVAVTAGRFRRGKARRQRERLARGSSTRPSGFAGRADLAPAGECRRAIFHYFCSLPCVSKTSRRPRDAARTLRAEARSYRFFVF